MIQVIDDCFIDESDGTENEENSVSPASRVVFLGELFTEVERVVPSPPEKQNDFASNERFSCAVYSRFRPRLKPFQSQHSVWAALAVTASSLFWSLRYQFDISISINS